jgi:hypothetical protein
MLATRCASEQPLRVKGDDAGCVSEWPLYFQLRKRVYIIGSVATGIIGFIYFAMLNTTEPAWIVLGIVLSFIGNDLMYSPQAALIAESFTPRLRYTGSCASVAPGLRETSFRRSDERQQCFIYARRWPEACPSIALRSPICPNIVCLLLPWCFRGQRAPHPVSS